MTGSNCGDISIRGPAIVQAWQQELVQLHPEMFVRTYRGVPFAPGYPSICGEGWRDISGANRTRIMQTERGAAIYFSHLKHKAEFSKSV